MVMKKFVDHAVIAMFVFVLGVCLVNLVIIFVRAVEEEKKDDIVVQREIPKSCSTAKILTGGQMMGDVCCKWLGDNKDMYCDFNGLFGTGYCSAVQSVYKSNFVLNDVVLNCEDIDDKKPFEYCSYVSGVIEEFCK